MSDTERVALEAGTVWWDAELFSGAPNWKKLIDHKSPGLSDKEKSFLANEVNEVCRMVDNEVIDETGDLDDATWQYLKDKGFMGIIIPESYGGLGFSAEANSAIVAKVSSRSVTLAVTVMVPNSLGPAELLLHYGTEEQKDHYLPLLANGREVPAFALTEPGAGSDASSMSASGVICKGQWEGEEVTGIRLNWDKRYITLAPIATLLGLAFKLNDPDKLIGDKEAYGITCALIPAETPGVETGRRHDPLGVKFLNGPTTGKDVFVPLDAIIGGKGMAGQGWRMLMDCLSAGRSISLPGLACGAAEVSTRAMTAYTQIRQQFGMEIGKFEGIEEPLSRIVGKTYVMNAARTLTAGAVACGEKPSVISAIVKAYLTEDMRTIVNDAMDIQGGAGISRGPRNVMARIYQAIPIGITVEGANILTRTLIIYGQGAIRCHPYALKEMEAARHRDLPGFDKYFWKHTGFVLTNFTRAKTLGITNGIVASAPTSGPTADYFKQLSRMSAAFGAISDTCMATLGGNLKRKELITGRLADALAGMYMGSATLKRFLDEGQKPEHKVLMQWGCETALHDIEEALIGVCNNLPMRWLGVMLKLGVFPLGRKNHGPSDRLTQAVARASLSNNDLRDSLTADIYHPEAAELGLGALDAALITVRAAEEPRRKVKAAIKAGTLPRGRVAALLDEAITAGVLSIEESDLVHRSLAAREQLIQVDAYDHQQYLARCGS